MKHKQLSELPANIAAKLAVEFRKYGSSEIDEIEIDETGEVIAVGHRCTRPNCACSGWYEKTGVRPIGDTVIVHA